MDEEKTDYRKASPQEVYTVKKIIIREWRSGKKTNEIQQNTGMCINIVRETIRKYKEGGLKAIQPKKEGRPVGSCMTLSQEQIAEVRKAIIDKNPDQLKLDFALWTRKAVKDLIKRNYGIDMPIRTVGEYLKRWGFTPQKPAKISRHQNSEADMPEAAFNAVTQNVFGTLLRVTGTGRKKRMYVIIVVNLIFHVITSVLI